MVILGLNSRERFEQERPDVFAQPSAGLFGQATPSSSTAQLVGIELLLLHDGPLTCRAL